MKRTLLLLSFLLWGCPGLAAPLKETRTLRETLSFPAGESRRTLRVDTINGSLKITAEERTDVAVVIVETIEGKDAAAIARAKTEARLDRTPGPGRTVRLYADGPWRCRKERGNSDDCKGNWNLPYQVRYDLELRVPRDLDLDLSTVNAGDIEIDGVMPRHFDIGNVNGAIKISGLTGEGAVTTVNGGVTVHFAKNPTGPCRVKTVNGKIDLGLQSGVGAEVTAATQNGEIYSDFAVTAGAAHPVRVEAARGGRKIYKSSTPTFRLGGGGATFELATINGDILVRDLGTSR